MKIISQDEYLQAKENAGSRASSNVVDKLVSFLNEHKQELKSGTSAVITAQEFNGTKTCHYWQLFSALQPIITKGKFKGQANKRYNKELAKAIELVFDKRLENAQVAEFKILVK